MSDDVIARAEAALEGVSEGDWGVDPYPHYDLDDWQTDNFSSLTAEELASAAYYDVDGGNGEWIAHCGERADAEFIAAARSLLPELVAELKTTRAQLAAIDALAGKWETVVELGTGNPSIVARAFAAEIRAAMEAVTDA